MKKVEDRFSPSRIRQIKKGLKNGARVEEAHTVEEIRDFSRMLHKVYSSRIRRYFPANDFFRHMNNMLIKGKQAKIFVVKYKEKIIGGSVCIYSGDDAYLWFSGGMRKTYALQYPACWPFGKHWKMRTNGDSATWNLWMWDFHSADTAIVISFSVSEENKAVLAAGSASVGVG